MPARPRRQLRAAGWLTVTAALAAPLALSMPEPPLAMVSLPLPYSGAAGGWSGIDVSADGARFWAVTDSGRRTSGLLVRQDGALAGIEAPSPRRLPGLENAPETVVIDDAEGLDVSDDGRELWVSFEGKARLVLYAGAESDGGHAYPPPPALRLGSNAGFEALARDAGGRLYTLPERPEGGYGPIAVFPLYRLDPVTGRWDIAARLTHDKEWLGVGADFGPDGGFYLLERRFGGIGFATRIRRFVLWPGAGLIDGQTLYVSPVGRHGNLEGIGIWRDRAGALRAVMVADDNHLSFQRSEIVEITLPLAPEAGGQ